MFNNIAHPIIIVRQNGSPPAEYEADCACPTIQPPRPTISMPQTPTEYKRATGLVSVPLNEEWWYAFQPHSPVVPVVLNNIAQTLLETDGVWLDDGAVQPPAHERILAERTFWQQLIETELMVPKNYVPSSPPTSDVLTAWMHLTNACNLRCPYCYLDKTRDAMSLETGMHALESVFRSGAHHGYRSIKLKYAGGEPTLRFSLFAALAAHAPTLAKEYGLGLNQVILSNGTQLDDARIQQLQALDVRLMISLDGIGSGHDVQRPFVDGRGSFPRVAKNIERCLTFGLVPNISITVSQRNLAGLSETVSYCLERDLPFSLNLYRENDCSASFTDLRLEETQLIEAFTQVYQVIEKKLPRQNLLGALSDRASFLAPHAQACGAGKDYLVIDHHGRVAKCQMDITHPVTTIRAPDMLHELRIHPASVQNVEVGEKEGCRTCEWRYWCAGGCALATFRATGRYDVKSPNCNIYKALYPQVLRLEALRLVREHLLSETRSIESN